MDMADPFPIAARVVGLVGVCSSTAQGIIKIIRAVRHASDEPWALSKEMNDFIAVLKVAELSITDKDVVERKGRLMLLSCHLWCNTFES